MVYSQLHHTEESLKRLGLLLGNPSSLIPHVHCFGDYDSELLEKVESILTLLEESGEWKVVRINCIYLDGNLKNFLLCLAEAFGIKDKQLTIEHLGHKLREVLGDQRLLLALYDSHAFEEFNHSVANAILNIPELVPGCRILTISESSWDTTATTQGFNSTSVQIYVKNTLDEDTIVAKLTELLEPEGIKENLVRLAVSATSCHSRDLKFIKKIIMAASEQKDKEVISFISSEMRSMENKLFLASIKDQHDVALISLPVELKLFLLASFFATHNTVPTDKRFFTKNHGREKRSELREKHMDSPNSESGPKSADMQRILFIRNALVGLYRREVEKEANVKIEDEINPLPLMTTLSDMALIDMSSAKSNLDQPKFRCMIAHDLANKIAASLHIQLREHLENSNF